MSTKISGIHQDPQNWWNFQQTELCWICIALVWNLKSNWTRSSKLFQFLSCFQTHLLIAKIFSLSQTCLAVLDWTFSVLFIFYHLFVRDSFWNVKQNSVLYMRLTHLLYACSRLNGSVVISPFHSRWAASKADRLLRTTLAKTAAPTWAAVVEPIWTLLALNEAGFSLIKLAFTWPLKNKQDCACCGAATKVMNLPGTLFVSFQMLKSPFFFIQFL